jgi:hypothetical protein
MNDHTEPPASVELDLDEALLLVVALEDALKIFERLLGRAPLQANDLIGPMANVETQLRLLERKIGWDQGGHDAG